MRDSRNRATAAAYLQFSSSSSSSSQQQQQQPLLVSLLLLLLLNYHHHHQQQQLLDTDRTSGGCCETTTTVAQPTISKRRIILARRYRYRGIRRHTTRVIGIFITAVIMSSLLLRTVSNGFRIATRRSLLHHNGSNTVRMLLPRVVVLRTSSSSRQSRHSHGSSGLLTTLFGEATRSGGDNGSGSTGRTSRRPRKLSTTATASVQVLHNVEEETTIVEEFHVPGVAAETAEAANNTTTTRTRTTNAGTAPFPSKPKPRAATPYSGPSKKKSTGNSTIATSTTTATTAAATNTKAGWAASSPEVAPTAATATATGSVVSTSGKPSIGAHQRVIADATTTDDGTLFSLHPERLLEQLLQQSPPDENGDDGRMQRSSSSSSSSSSSTTTTVATTTTKIPYPKALSPSSIKEFRSCPQSFFFQYILNLRQPANLALAKGSMCHAALERVFDLDPDQRTLNVLQNLFRAAWSESRSKDLYRPLFETTTTTGPAAAAAAAGEAVTAVPSPLPPPQPQPPLQQQPQQRDLEREAAWGKEGLQLLQNYWTVENAAQVPRPNPVQREVWVRAKLPVDAALGVTFAAAATTVAKEAAAAGATTTSTSTTTTAADDIVDDDNNNDGAKESASRFLVRGIIDRLDMVQDTTDKSAVTLRLIDYKSGKAPDLKYSAAMNSKIQAEAFEQLLIYSLLLRESGAAKENPMPLRYLRLFYLTSVDEEAVYWDMDLGATQEERDILLQSVHQTLAEVWTDIMRMIDLQDFKAFQGCNRSFCYCHKCRSRFVPGTVWEP